MASRQQRSTSRRPISPFPRLKATGKTQNKCGQGKTNNRQNASRTSTTGLQLQRINDKTDGLPDIRNSLPLRVTHEEKIPSFALLFSSRVELHMPPDERVHLLSADRVKRQKYRPGGYGSETNKKERYIWWETPRSRISYLGPS